MVHSSLDQVVLVRALAINIMVIASLMRHLACIVSVNLTFTNTMSYTVKSLLQQLYSFFS